MKWHFVLDENIVILAHKREDHNGTPDDTCLNLIRDIIRQCHAFVMTDDIWRKYARQVDRLKKDRVPMVPGIMGAIRLALTNVDKDTRLLSIDDLLNVQGQNDAPLGKIPHVDDGDQEFVKAAASVEDVVLVTTDGPLRAALLAHDIPNRYEFQLQSPAEALSFLRDLGP